MSNVTFSGSGTLAGTGTSLDGPATVSMTFTPTSAAVYSCAPNGPSLVNTAGTWTWGGVAASGGWYVLLNGAIAGGNGAGTQLYLLSGAMYVTNGIGSWWQWTGSYWLSVNPPSPLPPACP